MPAKSVGEEGRGGLDMQENHEDFIFCRFIKSNVFSYKYHNYFEHVLIHLS